MSDYYSLLNRAVAKLGSNTAQTRGALYETARRAMDRQLQSGDPPLSAAQIDREQTAFEGAVDRIEAETAYRNGIAPQRPGRRRRPLPDWQNDTEFTDRILRPKSRYILPTVLSVLGAAAVVAIGMVSYSYLTRQPTRGAGTEASLPDNAGFDRTLPPIAVARTSEDLAPGVDGGSSDSGIPYVYRRQPVYYRTVYSVGMTIVDRSQRFLYLIQPKTMALRYGIGVGGECVDPVGLRRIVRKAEWPEWVPSPELIKLRSYPPRMGGGPGNPLGARALDFDNGIGIHGTNAPKTIGQAVSLGCLRMVNDDVVDLYSRVATGTAVVVLN